MITLYKIFGTGRSNVLTTARTTVVHYDMNISVNN